MGASISATSTPTSVGPIAATTLGSLSPITQLHREGDAAFLPTRLAHTKCTSDPTSGASLFSQYVITSAGSTGVIVAGSSSGWLFVHADAKSNREDSASRHARELVGVPRRLELARVDVHADAQRRANRVVGVGARRGAAERRVMVVKPSPSVAQVLSMT